MRTLVIGIPLPHVSFDNYSFASAPALSDYARLIVEASAVSTVVEDVVAGSGGHRNFAGQLLHNAQSTAAAFSLSDLLSMRRREAEWFFARGGTAVCFAHPRRPASRRHRLLRLAPLLVATSAVRVHV